MGQPNSTITASTAAAPGSSSLSLKGIFLRFKWRISLTLSLVVLETLLGLLYPLFLGWAINDLLNGTLNGIYLLVGLGVASVVIGSSRRFFDTRIYAHIYQTITPEMVAREKAINQSVSTIAARSNLLTELVEFFENALPEVVVTFIGLAGVLIILSALNLNVFFACLALLVLIVVIYLAIGSLNYELNSSYNNELENQVETIKQSDGNELQAHYQRLMQWNIKLSDLETGTYFVLWLGIIALLVYAPITAINSGATDYGLLIALLMYVFEYTDKTAALPLYVQQVIRLREIANRIG